MGNDWIGAFSAGSVVAAGTRLLAVEFPDRRYTERLFRLWAERKGLTSRVWSSSGTEDEGLGAAIWPQAAAYAALPESLALVHVPDGELENARRAAATALPPAEFRAITWLQASDLFFANRDIERLLAFARSMRTPQQVSALVGFWPQLVALETGVDTALGTIEDAIKLLLDTAELGDRRRQFLRRCAVPEILTCDAMETVWDEDDRAPLTRWAVERGWICRSDDPSTIGFVPARWRAVLLQELDQAQPGAVPHLSRLLAQQYQTRGAASDVLLRQVQRTGDTQLIVSVLQNNLVDLIANHTGLARSALRTLPASLVADMPWLRVGREFAVEGLTPSGALNRTGFRRSAAPRLSAPETALRTMISKRLQGKAHEAAQAADVVRKVAEQPAGDETWPARDDLDIVFIHIGVTMLLDGNLTQARLDFERAFEAWWARPGFSQRDALGKLALVSALQGELTESERLLGQVADYPLPGGPFRNRVLISERLAPALIAAERLDVSGVRTAWESGNLKASIDDEELWPFIVLVAQRCASVLGADAIALQSADALLGKVKGGLDEFGVALAQTARAESLLSLGDLTGARTALDGIGNRENQFTQLASARLSLLRGRFAEASRLAGRLAISSGTGAASRVEALFLAAAAIWALGQHGEAARLARTAAATADAQGMRRPFLAVPESIASELFPASGITTAPHGFASGGEVIRAPDLTPAQRSVLAILTSTGTTLKIAEQLHLSRNTVKTHLRTLYRALGAHTRAEALAAAARYGLLH